MSRLPLEGICVVDLTHSWAGPHATRLLADFGAEVILVEYPRRLGMHRAGKIEDRAYDRQPLWYQVNRNKYAVTLDLEEPRSREAFADLVRHADVLVENSRPGVMDRLGFGRPALLALRPELITLSMPAYGSTGPLHQRPAYGGGLEVMGGIQNLTGYSPDGKPQRVKEMDVLNGTGAAAAIMTALLVRQRTGRGQHIELAQLEFGMHSLIGEHLLEFAATGHQAQPRGNRHRFFAPQGCYAVAGDDCWITLTVRSDAQWQRLCEAIGRGELASDSRFATSDARMEQHDAIDAVIEAWSHERSAEDALETLQALGIPSALVATAADLTKNPQLAARGYFVEGVDPDGKKMMGLPFRLSRTSGSVRWRGPKVGEHNEQVICGKLGRPPEAMCILPDDQIGTSYDI